MLANLVRNKPNLTLIKNSGIQFLDFGLTPQTAPDYAGRFVRKSANGPLLRLDYDATADKYRLPAGLDQIPEIARPEMTISLGHSLQLFDKIWLPLPFLRCNPGPTFAGSPTNWARVQIARLGQPDDAGNTLRICLAFDSKLHTDDEAIALAPGETDVCVGTHYALAWSNADLAEFIDQTWVDGWLREIFIRFASEVEKRSEQEIISALRAFEYQAHYLNLLEMLAVQLPLPTVKLTGETPRSPIVPVDLVLDIGNTHTCGILIEDHGDKNEGINQCRELAVRSLSEPQYLSGALFSSRLEFNEARFGRLHFSWESGRDDAFIWPSIARVGDEAQRLALTRAGTESASGVSSARRYLWDETPARQPWRFSQPDVKQHPEPNAAALPLMNLINDCGQPLYLLPMEDRLPVFSPNYSRSALMTLMLCELLAQAICQMNSVSQRQSMGFADSPRQLRNLILTLPSAMPKPEREIFSLRVQEAIALVWKALEWHPHDDGVSLSGRCDSLVPRPEVQIEWDEATCGQLVWLYNESQIHYAGQSEAFFRRLVRPDRQSDSDDTAGRTLRVASIDIGGGTTDMSITQYQLDDGQGSNVKISPRLLFREGFKIAGDDLLLDVIQQCVLPAFQQAMQKAGIVDPAGILSAIFGKSGRMEIHNTLRQQATLQLLIPLGLAILQHWSTCDPQDAFARLEARTGDLLKQTLTDNVQQFIQQSVRPFIGSGHTFDLLDATLEVEMKALQDALLDGRFSLTAPLRMLCEVISHYCCDILLVTGQPSCLPGVQALIRQLQPVPIARIVWMEHYPVARRFPFTPQEGTGNPKSSAALGAMLYSLARDLRLPGFNFQATSIQTWSTVRHLGILENNGMLKESQVWYRDIDLDDPHASLNTDEWFPLRGNACLGFRQLENENWPASPLYTLRINSLALAKAIAADDMLYVRLRRVNRCGSFGLAEARLRDGAPVPLDELSFTLNTLVRSTGGTEDYWIDSGSVL